MAEITWSPRGRRQLEIILSVIAREAGASVAEKWGRRFTKAVRLVEQFPEIGSPVEELNIPGVREQIVGPYRVIYQFDGTACHIAFVLRAEKQLDSGLTQDDLFQ